MQLDGVGCAGGRPAGLDLRADRGAQNAAVITGAHAGDVGLFGAGAGGAATAVASIADPPVIARDPSACVPAGADHAGDDHRAGSRETWLVDLVDADRSLDRSGPAPPDGGGQPSGGEARAGHSVRYPVRGDLQRPGQRRLWGFLPYSGNLDLERAPGPGRERRGGADLRVGDDRENCEASSIGLPLNAVITSRAAGRRRRLLGVPSHARHDAPVVVFAPTPLPAES